MAVPEFFYSVHIMKTGSTQHPPASDTQVPDGPLQARVTRRRFVAGASGAAGVLLAVQARTALGQVACQSPSAMVSGNQSARPEEGPCAGGFSPGFWKQPQKFGSWSNAIPPLFNGQTSNYCPDLDGQGKLPGIADPGTLASEILSGAPGVSMWLVLADPESYPNGQLMRHLLSAWLNCGYLGPIYPLTTDQIQEMWSQLTISPGLYYPNGSGPGMTAYDVIDYISGMYDLGMASMNGPDICAAETTTTTPTTGDTGSGTTGGSTTPGGGKNKNKG